jgi:outer membrane protein assembly factor BamB
LITRRGWKTKLPQIEWATLPEHTTRPNPLVADDKLFASIFAPGAVCGLTRRTGKLLWRTALNSFGGSGVTFAHGTLFATSCRTLYALAPRTGAVRWEFTPYSEPGEWIYSQPTISQRRVFIGDRVGDFHCLDATTGKPIWRRRTSRDSSNQVNATALIAGRCVITANNAGVVVCYAIHSGKTIWRRRVEGPCTRELLRLGSNVVVGANSINALDVNTGAVRLKVGFPEKAVSAITVANGRLLVVFGPDLRIEDQDGSQGYELVVMERGRIIARRPVNGIDALRTCSDTGLVFHRYSSLMEAIDPSTGNSIRLWRRRMALPDCWRGFLYGLTDEGIVFAERRPELFARGRTLKHK